MTTIPVADSEIPERSRNITRGITSLSIQNVGTSILGFVFLGGLIRLLPPIQYSVYSAIAICVAIASSIAAMGLQYAAARYLSSGANRARQGGKILLLTLAFSALVTGAYVLASPTLSLYFTRSTSWAPVFVLGGFWLFSSSIASVLQGILQGLKKYTLLAGVLFLARSVMVVLTIAGLSLSKSVTVAIGAWSVYSLLIITVCGVAAWHAFRGEVSSFDSSAGFGDILRYSIPLGVAATLTIVTSYADLVVVGGYLAPAALGVYNTAVQIATVLTFVLVTPLITALLPEVSSSAFNGSGISNGLRLALRFVILTVLPASFLFAAMSKQLLVVFSGGGTYLSGSTALELISLFFCFLAVQTVVYSILQATGKTMRVFLIAALTTATDFGSAILLVPNYGLMGAAIARALTAIVGMSLALWTARNYLGGGSIGSLTFYAKALVSSTVPLALVYALSTFVSFKVVTLIPYALLGIGSLFLCLRLLHVLSEEDLALLGHIVPSFARPALRILVGSPTR